MPIRKKSAAFVMSCSCFSLFCLVTLITAPPAAAGGLIGREIVKLTDAIGTGSDLFGNSVAVSGDTAVAGLPQDDLNGSNSGSAFVFSRHQGGGDSWGKVKTLTPSDPLSTDNFGFSVAADGNFVVVGSPYDDDNGASSGSAYVFYRGQGGVGNWGQVAKMIAPDGDISDAMGRSVAISDGIIAVASPYDDDHGLSSGAVYLFYRNQGGADNWGYVKKLTPADGAAGDVFGESLSLDGDILAVGAAYDDDSGSNAGSAYIFYRNQGGDDAWGQIAKLTAADGAADDYYGASVSVSGGVVIVGAYRDDDGGSNTGSAYVYYRNQGGADAWGQAAKLTASDRAAGDEFGWSVSVSGPLAVVGSHFDDDGAADAGSAYVFHRNEGGADAWGQTAKMTASAAEADTRFGHSVSADGAFALVGAIYDDHIGVNPGPGAAYVEHVRHHSDDFGADGKDDILWRNSVSGNVYVWNMDGPSALSSLLVGTVADSAWQIVGDGDFNGDGFTDILWRHTPAGTVFAWLLRDGAVIGTGTCGEVADPDWEILRVRDYNADGRDDILWRHAVSGEVFLWSMKGTTVAGTASLGFLGAAWTLED